jgi:hypothetical protein
VESASVRALLPQTVLRLLREGEPHVIAALGDRYAAIDERFRLGWVPVPLYLGLLEQVRHALGDERFRVLYREAVLATVKKPALRGLIETGIRLLGATPTGLLKWTPRLWNALFQGLGEIEFLPEPVPHVRWHGIPAGFTASGTSVIAFAGAFDALFALTRHSGRVDIAERGGEVMFTLHVDEDQRAQRKP